MWYRRASEQGNVDAQRELAIINFYGDRVPRDPTQAVLWWRKAADQGDPRAQADLGSMYEKGLGVIQDYAQALMWCRKSAEQQAQSGQLCLGEIYRDGLGVPPDRAQAIMWFRKAADKGSPAARRDLGLMYARPGYGHYLPDHILYPNLNALYSKLRAAEQGDAEAQYNFGLIYVSGDDILPQDYTQAVKWFILAADRASDPAIRELAVGARERVTAKATPSQVAEAQQMAREWVPWDAPKPAQKVVVPCAPVPAPPMQAPPEKGEAAPVVSPKVAAPAPTPPLPEAGGAPTQKPSKVAKAVPTAPAQKHRPKVTKPSRDPDHVQGLW
jgi:TPR repeat protein